MDFKLYGYPKFYKHALSFVDLKTKGTVNEFCLMGSKLVVSKISTINYNLQKWKFSLSTLGTSISISISRPLCYPLRSINCLYW